jgi:hypothetical protein
LALESEFGGLREAIAAIGAKLKEDLGSVERQMKDCQWQSQEREAQAMAEVRNIVGQIEAPLQAVVEENGRQMLAAAEMRRSEEQLRAEVGRLNLWVEVLEQGNQWLSEANEVTKPDVGTALPEQSAKMKQDLTNLERALTKLMMQLSLTEEGRSSGFGHWSRR